MNSHFRPQENSMCDYCGEAGKIIAVRIGRGVNNEVKRVRGCRLCAGSQKSPSQWRETPWLWTPVSDILKCLHLWVVDLHQDVILRCCLAQISNICKYILLNFKIICI